MAYINYIPIEDFDKWDEVFDYESDEAIVALFDKNGTKMAEFGCHGFTASDLERFKNNK